MEARLAQGLTQAALAKATGLNRSILSRLESGNYTPSIDQLLALSDTLSFQPSDVLTDLDAPKPAADQPAPLPRRKIAVAGTGYVGLSLAVLLAQHNDVTAVGIVPEKVEMLNSWKSPIQDDFIERYLAEAAAGTRTLTLTATTDGAAAYADADFVVVAAPTNYDPRRNFFDTSAVEAVIELVLNATRSRADKPAIVIKSTVPVGYTKHVRERYGTDNIVFSPEFLRESKALYDNLYPSRIIVGTDDSTRARATEFAALLAQSSPSVSKHAHR